jgi:alkylation response protein AidB-like acyl-CoA dehydrogenase
MIFELTEQQQAFRDRIGEFATSRVAPRAAAIDDEGTFPRELIAEAAPLGLMGVNIPRALGGAGLDYVSYALAIEALALASAVVAVIAAVHNSLVVEPIAEFGSDAQKATWLKRLARGEALGAFALSEEHAGSDAANQQTAARREGQEYLLNGRKVWVANAEAADVFIVFASTQSGTDRAVSAFLVPADSPGLSRVVTAESLGVRGLGCMDIELNDVRLDADALLGPAGEGFRVAMWALDGGRVAIAAQALGVGTAAIQEAIDYARHREAFGKPIATYQAIQWMLADAATDLEAARLLTWKAADARQRQSRPTFEASMAKLFASESAHRAADRAMQILASKGYRRGSAVERLFRDVRATEIYQGTSEVQRMVIAEHILS